MKVLFLKSMTKNILVDFDRTVTLIMSSKTIILLHTLTFFFVPIHNVHICTLCTHTFKSFFICKTTIVVTRSLETAHDADRLGVK